MLQILKTHAPIPSCEIAALEYNEKDEHGNMLPENERWIYIYEINTPELIKPKSEMTKEEIQEQKFVVYGHIMQLNVKYDEYGDLSSNIHFSTLEDYMEILNSQRQADLDYRVDYLKRHPKTFINTVVLENRNYDKSELSKCITYLSTILFTFPTQTIFAAVK